MMLRIDIAASADYAMIRYAITPALRDDDTRPLRRHGAASYAAATLRHYAITLNTECCCAAADAAIRHLSAMLMMRCYHAATCRDMPLITAMPRHAATTYAMPFRRYAAASSDAIYYASYMPAAC